MGQAKQRGSFEQRRNAVLIKNYPQNYEAKDMTYTEEQTKYNEQNCPQRDRTLQALIRLFAGIR